MQNKSGNSVIQDHFKRSLSMLRAAVEGFPAEHWRSCGSIRPAGVAVHVAETIEYYISGKQPSEFEWGHRFGIDWQDTPNGELPNQKDTLEYIQDVEKHLELWLQNADLAAPETIYPHVGSTLLARSLYILRNTQHHVGQLGLALNQIRKKSPQWR